MVNEKPEENIEQKGQIEAVPSAFTYAVEIDGERIETPNIETAVILAKLEKIDQNLKKLLEKK